MEPYIGEVRIFGFGFAPVGWARCDGALLPLAQFQELWSIISTRFGGDGTTTFGLPDLRSGRTPIGAGNGPAPRTPRRLGETGGYADWTLTKDQLPNHTHVMNATLSPADVSSPTADTALARSTGKNAYGHATNLVKLNDKVIGTANGDGHPHNNLMPYQVLNFCIALKGIYPPHT